MMEQRNIIQVTDEHRCDCTAVTKSIHFCVSGTVSDHCGTPISGVCVKIVTAGYEPVLHTLTDSQGAFSLIWNRQEKEQLIFAKNGYMTLQLRYFEDGVKVYLEKEILTCVVSGRLLYKNGVPAAPVKVQMVNNCVNLCVFSKPNGCYYFTKVPSGKYTLIIEGNECRKKSIYVTIPTCCHSYYLGTIRVDQINILCTIHGIISDPEGHPIKNAVVILTNAYTMEPVGHTLSNENGLYFFGNIRNGCYYVEAYG